MNAVPLSLKEANELVKNWHRHHKPTVGYKFAIGCEHEEQLIGAAIVGRPVSREINYRKVTEVTRLVTDGTKNACSFLYSACARTAKGMGYRRIQTYILDSELGTSLRAAGWIFDGMTAGGDWNHSKANAGTRRTDQPMCRKQRWIKELQ
jgi:hypothetical protein